MVTKHAASASGTRFIVGKAAGSGCSRAEASVDGRESNFSLWKARLASKEARVVVDDEAVSVSMLVVAAGGLMADTGDGGGVCAVATM